jgi:hypothetical protein
VFRFGLLQDRNRLRDIDDGDPFLDKRVEAKRDVKVLFNDPSFACRSRFPLFNPLTSCNWIPTFSLWDSLTDGIFDKGAV